MRGARQLAGRPSLVSEVVRRRPHRWSPRLACPIVDLSFYTKVLFHGTAAEEKSLCCTKTSISHLRFTAPTTVTPRYSNNTYIHTHLQPGPVSLPLSLTTVAQSAEHHGGSFSTPSELGARVQPFSIFMTLHYPLLSLVCAHVGTIYQWSNLQQCHSGAPAAADKTPWAYV